MQGGTSAINDISESVAKLLKRGVTNSHNPRGDERKAAAEMWASSKLGISTRVMMSWGVRSRMMIDWLRWSPPLGLSQRCWLSTVGSENLSRQAKTSLFPHVPLRKAVLSLAGEDRARLVKVSWCGPSPKLVCPWFLSRMVLVGWLP